MDFKDRIYDFIRDTNVYRLITREDREPVVAEKSRLTAFLNLTCWMLSFDNLLVSALNFSFWNIIILMIFTFNLNTISIVCFILMIFVSLECLCELVELEEYPQYITEQQLFTGLKKAKQCFFHLRQEMPYLFYTILVMFFSMVYVVGRSMNGISVCYTAFLLIYFSKYIIKIIPQKFRDNVCIFVNHVQNIDGVIEESDLIPYNTDDSNGDKDTDLDSLLTDRTQESANNSLASGLSTMPSYLDEDYVQDDTIQEDDLLPSSKPKPDDSSDSDLSEHRNIEFDSIYFNKDSSDTSEDENSYSKGLKFSDAVDSKKVPVQESSEYRPYLNIASFINNIMVATSQQENLQQEVPLEESDSDFEMIYTEDIEDDNV